GTWLGTECNPSLPGENEAFGQGDGFEHGFGFVHGLLVFALGSGVVHPAAAGLHVGFAIFDEGGADGDAAIKVSIEGKIADAAAVRAAGGLFELGDDLHGADFGRATEGAGGEGGPHQGVGGRIFGKDAFNLGDDVHV